MTAEAEKERERQFVPLVKYDLDGGETTIWIEKSEGLFNLIKNIANVSVVRPSKRKNNR